MMIEMELVKESMIQQDEDTINNHIDKNYPEKTEIKLTGFRRQGKNGMLI